MLLDSLRAACALWLLAAGLVLGQLDPGSAVPAISLGEALTHEEGAPDSLADLRGRWTLLDFFAVWCPACRANVGHMNALADEAEGLGCSVVSLSADSRSLVERFLEGAPLRTRVMLDEGGAIHEAFEVGGYPQAVLIDPEGKIAAFVRPDEVTPEVLREVVRHGSLENVRISRARSSGKPADPGWPDRVGVGADALLATAVIGHSPATERVFIRFDEARRAIIADGVPFEALVRHAYAVNEHTLRSIPENQGRYRVHVAAPGGGHEPARAMLRSLIEATFSCRPVWEEEQREVVVLTRDRSVSSPAFRESQGQDADGFAGRGGFMLTAVEMGFVTESLARYVFGAPVIDATGITGRVDVQISWDPSIPSDPEARCRDAGLIGTREHRAVRVLRVVESDADPDSARAEQSPGND